MNYISKMRTFKEYLEERNIFATAALTGALLGSGAALLKSKKDQLPLQQSPAVSVTPRATNAEQAKTTVTTTEEPAIESQSAVTTYTPSHPLIGKLLNAFSQAEHRGTGNIDFREFNPRHAIRTKAGEGKSSAWGVFQITGSTAKDYATRKPHLFDDETREYALKYADIGKQMLNAPNNHPTLGLGKPTPLANPDEHHLYLRMSDAVLRGMGEDMKMDLTKPLNNQQIAKITKRFRGVNEPKYLDIVTEHLR